VTIAHHQRHRWAPGDRRRTAGRSRP
jgi:hypothetical protein